jgi:hypothetical protein
MSSKVVFLGALCLLVLLFVALIGGGAGLYYFYLKPEHDKAMKETENQPSRETSMFLPEGLDPFERDKEKAALAKAMTIRRAAEKWRLTNDEEEVPTIDQLLAPGPVTGKPVLDPEDVWDPWGGRYTIANGPHNEIQVFTISPSRKHISTSNR